MPKAASTSNVPAAAKKPQDHKPKTDEVDTSKPFTFEAGGDTYEVSGIAEAARWDDVANTLRVGGYGTVDARVSWRFAPGWTLQANLVNAFDRDYQTSAWYAQPGREWALSLRWQPQ